MLLHFRQLFVEEELNQFNWRIILYYVKDHVYKTSNNLDIRKINLIEQVFYQN
jgi:hypothetical protein